MKWGVGSGIITGKSKDALKPRDRGTRAEIATMLERFIKNFIE